MAAQKTFNKVTIKSDSGETIKEMFNVEVVELNIPGFLHFTDADTQCQLFSIRTTPNMLITIDWFDEPD